MAVGKKVKIKTNIKTMTADRIDNVNLSMNDKREYERETRPASSARMHQLNKLFNSESSHPPRAVESSCANTVYPQFIPSTFIYIYPSRSRCTNKNHIILFSSSLIIVALSFI